MPCILSQSCVFNKVFFVFILGSNYCFGAVLRPDTFPEPNDLQSEEQGAARVHQKDFKQVQTCCWFSCEGNQHSVLTGKENYYLDTQKLERVTGNELSGVLMSIYDLKVDYTKTFLEII